MYHSNGEPMEFDEHKAYETDVPGAPAVWVFDSTGGAYNTTQVEEDIRDGDILLVPREGVAGWLDAAWPTAATDAHGEFHALTPEAVASGAFTDKLTQVRAVWDEYQSRATA